MIDSGITSTPYTMAVDDALLHTNGDGHHTNTLHMYRRDPPAVSLGYFQNVHEDVDLSYCSEHGIEVYRRLSGGGTIFCDRGQLIFSLVLDEKGLGCIEDSFPRIASVMVRTVESLGVKATFSPPNDVVVDGKKISGQAQRRYRGSVLHHATLLVDTDIGSMFKALRVSGEKTASKGLDSPEQRVASLASLLNDPPSFEELKALLCHHISLEFNVELIPEGLSDVELVLARHLEIDRYGNTDWNLSR